MKLFFILFLFLPIYIFSQTYQLDLEYIYKTQKEISKLRNQFMDFDDFLNKTGDASQDRWISETVSIYFTVNYILNEVYVLAVVQNHFLDELKKTEFDKFKDSEVEYCINQLSNVRSPLFPYRDAIENIQMKKNIDEFITLLNKTIEDLKKFKK